MQENKREKILFFGCFIFIFLYTCLTTIGLDLSSGAITLGGLFTSDGSFYNYIDITTGSEMDLFRNQMNLVYAAFYLILIIFKFYVLGRPYKTFYLQVTSKTVLSCLFVYAIGSICLDLNNDNADNIVMITNISYPVIIIGALLFTNWLYGQELRADKNILKILVSLGVTAALIVGSEQQIAINKINRANNSVALMCGYPSYDKVSGIFNIMNVETLPNNYIEKLNSIGEGNYFENNFEKLSNAELVGLKKEFLNYYTKNKSDFVKTNNPEAYENSMLSVRRNLTEVFMDRDVATINAFEKGGIDSVAELINNQELMLSEFQQILMIKNRHDIKFNKETNIVVNNCN